MDNHKGRKLRILFAAPYKAGIGGVIQWTDNIIDHYNALENPSVNVEVFQIGRLVPFNMASTKMRIYRGVIDYAKMIKRERQVMKQKQYDVFHLCTSASMSLIKDILMLKVAKRYNVRTVVHFHFGRIPALKKANNWEWKLLRWVVRIADVAVPIDQMSYDALYASGLSNAIYLPNPVSQEVADFVSTYREENPRDERMILYAGHCKKAKGVYELVQACKELGNVRLVLAGHIKEVIRKDLEELTNHEPWLEMLGPVPHEEVLKRMKQCGVFVLPSYTEGFPNVILEGMACGCAIVATSVGAIPEMIGEENGKHYGLLVPPQNVESLKTAIGKLLTDKSLREECRQNVPQRVNERYNIDTVWRKMTEIWQRATV